MTQPDSSSLAAILATTPTSQIAQLLTADLRWKTRAAEHLAQDILQRLGEPSRPHRDQLHLPF